jgi:hypothetical protein
MERPLGGFMQRPARVPSQLSESLHRHLNAYALVASAAGVGVLALVQPAEGRIVYTPTHQVISLGHPYLLDLNNDGTTDFDIAVGACTITTNKTTCLFAEDLFVGGAGSYNVVEAPKSYRTFRGLTVALALKSGTKIPRTKYTSHVGIMAGEKTTDGGGYIGRWFNVKNRYLGLVFFIDGKKHYGWARLNVTTHKHPFTVSATLTGYAYETIPNKPIITGKTKGPDDDEENNNPGASLTNPNPDIPQPASLGALALGAPGLSIWRRKESLGAAR